MKPGWRLIRVAVISVNGKPLEQGFHAQVSGVEVTTGPPLTIDGKPAGTLVVASLAIRKPRVGVAGLSVRPLAEARVHAESAIESLTRLVAVDQRGKHSISSVEPCLGITGPDVDSLDGVAAVGISSTARQGAGGPANVLEQVEIQALADRLDGVALLAEALNSEGLGRYMQLMRLFERAFKVGPGALTEPLTTFLRSSAHRFTATEVKRWTDSRAYSAHADRRDVFFLEAQVRPLLLRMTEAAYDVLLNKNVWRTKDTQRRKLWKPYSGSRGNKGGIFMTQGKAASLQFQISDAFESYPLMLAGPLTQVIPRGLWLSHSGSTFAWTVTGEEAPIGGDHSSDGDLS